MIKLNSRLERRLGIQICVVSQVNIHESSISSKVKKQNNIQKIVVLGVVTQLNRSLVYGRLG